LAIIPGSLVGAVPPLIGFCAAGGIVTDMRIVLLSGFMFCWQIPHFWLILLKYHKEYEKAGFVTIFHLIDESQIKMLVFVWVLFSTTILSFFSVSGILFDRKISSILVPLNLLFISSFYYLLFRKCNKAEFRGAFILFNVFSLIILVLFIVNSFVSEI
jgi:protoheme IX farnesyltransferase